VLVGTGQDGCRSTALAAPVAARANLPTLQALAEKFRDDAKALDPRIQECWVGYDEIAGGPRDMRVMAVYFGRTDTPFVRPAISASDAPATITSLFPQWQAARQDPESEGEDEAAARMGRYVALQRRITAMRPGTVREAAMQFVVESDDGESEYREAFYRRLRRLAMEG